MATAMMAGMAALALMAQATPAPEDVAARFAMPDSQRPRQVYEDVLILAHGDNSGQPMCGIIATRIAVKALLTTGETTYFYQTWCVAGQALPPVSGLCRLVVVDRPGSDGFVVGENDMPLEDAPTATKMAYSRKDIERFSCTVSSESPTVPPGGGAPTDAPRL